MQSCFIKNKANKAYLKRQSFVYQIKDEKLKKIARQNI